MPFHPRKHPFTGNRLTVVALLLLAMAPTSWAQSGQPYQASPPSGYYQQQPYPQGTPPSGYAPQGYAPQGTAPQGYAPQGTAPQGYAPQGYAPQGTAPQGYAPQGYAPQGTAPQGYAPQGTPPQGTPYYGQPQGYNPSPYGAPAPRPGWPTPYNQPPPQPAPPAVEIPTGEALVEYKELWMTPGAHERVVEYMVQKAIVANPSVAEMSQQSDGSFEVVAKSLGKTPVIFTQGDGQTKKYLIHVVSESLPLIDLTKDGTKVLREPMITGVGLANPSVAAVTVENDGSIKIVGQSSGETTLSLINISGSEKKFRIRVR